MRRRELPEQALALSIKLLAFAFPWEVAKPCFWRRYTVPRATRQSHTDMKVRGCEYTNGYRVSGKVQTYVQTGSASWTNTIGTEVVSRCRAVTEVTPSAKITSGGRARIETCCLSRRPDMTVSSASSVSPQQTFAPPHGRGKCCAFLSSIVDPNRFARCASIGGATSLERREAGALDSPAAPPLAHFAATGSVIRHSSVRIVRYFSDIPLTIRFGRSFVRPRSGFVAR